MNNFLLFDSEKQNEDLFIVDDIGRTSHLNEVLKKKVGDEISLCLVNHSLAKGIINKLSKNSVEIQIIEKEEGLFLPLKLVVAVSRPPTMKKIIEHATSLGVSEFHFYRSELTEKSYLDSKILKEENYLSHLNFGLSQSKIFYNIPKIYLHESLPKKAFFENDQKFLLKMKAGKTFKDFPPKLSRPISLVLGPERGLTQEENLYFEEAGFRPIEIAPSILRVEIASFCAISQLFLFQN